MLRSDKRLLTIPTSSNHVAECDLLENNKKVRIAFFEQVKTLSTDSIFKKT